MSKAAINVLVCPAAQVILQKDVSAKLSERITVRILFAVRTLYVDYITAETLSATAHRNSRSAIRTYYVSYFRKCPRIHWPTMSIFNLNINLGQPSKLPEDCRTTGCGKGAVCNKDAKTYACSCPAGFSGNPQKECIQGKLALHICTLGYFSFMRNFGVSNSL